MVLREADVNDIPALSRVRLSVRENILSDPLKVTPELYADYLTRSGKGWLGETDGQVVGFCVASLADASIWALFVRPEYEARGTGRALLRLATQWLFEMGTPSISLTTEPGTRAARLYERQGWRRGEIGPGGEVSYQLVRPAGLDA